MILVAAVALVILSLPLTGKSLARLRLPRFRWTGAAIASLAVQVLLINVFPHSVPEAVAPVIHLGSYALVLAFAVRNLDVPWFWVIMLGGAGNTAAIAANGGVMPASAWALRVAGLDTAAGFANSAHVPGSRLQLLGDIFAVPAGWPLANVFSIGDVLLVIGAALLLHAPSVSDRTSRRGSRSAGPEGAAAPMAG